MRWWLLLLGGISGLLGACFGDLGTTCESDSHCAPGLQCFLGWCVVPGDASPGDACIAGPEVCNGIDDDCDGVIDDLHILGQPCFEDPQDPSRVVPVDRRRGACAMGGRLRCEGGVLTCEGLVLPAALDHCNGMDLDCDGRLDEDPPGDEVCDGNDNDCDMRTDEPPWPAEVCDGVDNDCDGGVDEAFPALGVICEVGVGECRREGVGACRADGMEVECVGEGGAWVTPGQPSIELCDRLDNDCDGAADNGFGALGDACEAGVGACRELGVQECAMGGLGTECGARPGMPGEEVCDAMNVDDDCDGIAEEACACGLVDVRDMIDDFWYRTTVLPRPVMPPDSGGLEGSCTVAGQSQGGSDRDEVVVRWAPTMGEPRVALVSVTSAVFDPQVYLRSPCAPGAVDSEQGCSLDSGVFGDGGRATMMVVVPDGAREGSIVVEAQGGAAAEAEFTVRVTDPTGQRERLGVKRLFIGGAELGGVDTCRKLIARDVAVGALPVFDELAVKERDAGWQERRLCIDNDGWRRSVHVEWAELVAGVGAELLAEGADGPGEAGDWWSTVVEDVPNGFELLLAPWDVGSVCAANSARLVARLTCSIPANMERDPCRGGPPLGVLVCEAEERDHNAVQCTAGILDGMRVPRRTLSLVGLSDGRCRATGGTLMLHVGVIRAAEGNKIGCTDPVTMRTACGGDGNPGQPVPAEQPFRYRLRLRVVD